MARGICEKSASEWVCVSRGRLKSAPHCSREISRLADFFEEGLGAAGPGFVALFLEGGAVGFVHEEFVEFVAGEVFFAAFEVEAGKLDAGAAVGVVFEDLFPGGEGGVFLAELGQCFGVGHEGVAVVVFGIRFDDAFEEWGGFVGFALAEEALAQVGLEIDVDAVAFDGGAVAFLGVLKFALLEIDVAEFGMVVGFIEVMDLGLEFFDAMALVGAGKFEAGGGAGLGAIDEEEIEDGADAGKENHEGRPDVFLAADRIDDHPNGKERDQQDPWVPQQVGIEQVEEAGHRWAK
jgi:hypothetical protein